MRPTDMPYMRDFVALIRAADEGSCRPDALERVLDRVEELEAEALQARLPRVWVLEIACREVVLRFENGRMSACATIKGDEGPESFKLMRDGLELVAGWPDHPDDSKEGGA